MGEVGKVQRFKKNKNSQYIYIYMSEIVKSTFSVYIINDIIVVELN